MWTKELLPEGLRLGWRNRSGEGYRPTVPGLCSSEIKDLKHPRLFPELTVRPRFLIRAQRSLWWSSRAPVCRWENVLKGQHQRSLHQSELRDRGSRKEAPETDETLISAPGLTRKLVRVFRNQRRSRWWCAETDSSTPETSIRCSAASKSTTPSPSVSSLEMLWLLFPASPQP